MFKSLFLVIPIILLSFCQNDGGQKQNSEAGLISSNSGSAFPSEEGKIVYDLTGNLVGTEVWYWAAWGKKQRKESTTVMEMMGIRQENSSVTVILEDKVYSLDTKKKTATLINTEMGNAFAQSGYTTDDAMEQFGGAKKGEKTLLGKTCQVWLMEQLMTETWIWKGLPLKTSVDMGVVKNDVTATSVELNPGLSSDLFDISGYEITDMGSLEDIMNGNY